MTKTYAARPNNTVIAATRNTSKFESVASLQVLTIGAGSKFIVKIVRASGSDTADAVELLREEHGIASLDAVIANAGICTPGPALTTSISDMRSHRSALSGHSSYSKPRLCFSRSPRVVNSVWCRLRVAASHFTVYGASKAAANFITREIHREHPNIVAVTLNLGYEIWRVVLKY